jgi:hypothetical protein
MHYTGTRGIKRQLHIRCGSLDVTTPHTSIFQSPSPRPPLRPAKKKKFSYKATQAQSGFYSQGIACRDTSCSLQSQTTSLCTYLSDNDRTVMYSSLQKKLNVFQTDDEVTTVSTSLLYNYKNISPHQVHLFLESGKMSFTYGDIGLKHISCRRKPSRMLRRVDK